MSGKGKISIITVVKDSVCLLEETILSVIEKMATAEIDYIVIDGGSTDGTTDIIRKYADQISYWVSEPDSGIYDAMNKGWATATDDSFILFLGAGDRLLSLPENMDRYSSQQVVYGNVQIGDYAVFTSKAGIYLKLYNSLHHQALMVNKSCHPDVPFNTHYKIYADFDFNQRLKKNGVRFIYSPQLLAYAHPGGVSDQRSFSETLSIINNNYGFFWMFLALGCFKAMNIFPFLKRLRPFQDL